MTRETKIGLLVGLGFIVVFAVLLSHTGSVPPPGDNIASSLVENKPGNKAILNGDIRTEIGQPESAPPVVDAPRPLGSSPEEPLLNHLEDRVVQLDDLPELPAPTILDPSGSAGVASAEQRRGDQGFNPPLSIVSIRTAPALPELEPQPSLPHDPPTQTAHPDSSEMSANNNGTKVAPPPTAPKEYVIQGGDSLVRIAQKHYQSSDQRLVEILVKSNEGRIKDANTIMEGQKLLIPDLPPEMFERAAGQNVQLAGQAVSMEDFMNSQRKAQGDLDKPVSEPRKAPAKPTTDSAARLSINGLAPVRVGSSSGAKATKPADKTPVEKAPTADKATTAKTSKSGKAVKPAKDDIKNEGGQLYRWYEVKPNDTMGAISRKELGSSQHWQEIKKLNGGVDPQKMRVGDRIKLPLKPVSSSTEKGRTSA